MQELSEQATPAVAILLQADPEELFEELGLRFEAIKQDPSVAGSFDLASDLSEESLGLEEVSGELRDFGRIFFHRVSVDAYTLVCGKGQKDTKERKSLLDAFKLGPEAVAATLAALMVTQLGLAPVVAAVVAALVVRLFFRNAHAAMCEVWAKNVTAKGVKRT